MDKEFYKSKTFWFGALWVVLGVAGLFGYADFEPSSDLEQIMEIVNGVLVILLRFLTNKGIKI